MKTPEKITAKIILDNRLQDRLTVPELSKLSEDIDKAPSFSAAIRRIYANRQWGHDAMSRTQNAGCIAGQIDAKEALSRRHPYPNRV